MSYQQGFSLIQLFISTLLGLMLSAALLSILYSVIVSNALRHSIETIQENAALALYFLSTDLINIGFSSCFEQANGKISITSTGAIAEFLVEHQSIQGQINQYKRSDAIRFVAVLEAGSELRQDMATTHASIDLVAVNGVKQQQELLITDCNNADVFKVSAIWRARLSHDARHNIDANLSVKYTKGALVYPLSLVSYKLARGVGGHTGLYRKVNPGNFQEMIPNVSQMRIEYGMRSALGEGVNYHSADDVDDFSAVVSLRIILLLHSTNPVLRKKMFYQDVFDRRIQAADLRFYKKYQLLITLRNSPDVLG